MKKMKISAVAFMVNVAAFAQQGLSRETQQFQKYLQKNIYTQTSYVNEGISGLMVLKVSFTELGVDSVSVISGLAPKIDNEVVAFIKKTPQKISEKMSEKRTQPIYVPLRFVISEN
jgi:hypothetical protein